MKQDASIRIPLYSSTRLTEDMIDRAGSVYDLFQVLKRIGADFGLPNFLVTTFPANVFAKASVRVMLTNWENELLHRCVEAKIFEQPLFTNRCVSILPSTARCSDFLLSRKFADLHSTLSQLVVCGHDIYAHFPVLADKRIWGGITFTGARENITQQEMIHLEHITGLAFVKLISLSADTDGTNPLNKREVECLRLTGEGLSVSEVARAINVSHHTVHYHLTNAVKKLDARNKIHAIVIALEKGWLGMSGEPEFG